MRRPLSLLPALVAAAATVAPALLVPAQGAAAPATTALPGAPAVEDDDPLRVAIDQLSPSEVPRRGQVRMQGTVTNVSEERWRAVNVYALISGAPMTTSEELAEARLVPPDTAVGERILTPGTFDSIGGLAPGETATFEVRLRRDQIPVAAPGVYWFGAHALGSTSEARDTVADGRARTFLPLLPASRATVDTSLVIPLRRPVRHTRSGRVMGERAWADDLRVGGHLRELVDLGAAARGRPFTWLLDPALPDVVQTLVAGNGPRSLGAQAAGRGDPDDPPVPDQGGSPSGSGSAAPAPEERPPAPGVAAVAGREWLDRLGTALDHGRVLVLPYGDVDVSAAQDHGPALLREARLRGAAQLDQLDLPGQPAVAAATGYLSTEALAALPAGTLALTTERMLPAGEEDRSLDVGGRHVLFTAADVADGGPGPDDPFGAVAMRQRILAEAAVRLLDERRPPVVVVLPPSWTPDRPRAFWRGLDVPWLSLVDPASLTSQGAVPADQLDYPPEQRAAELPAANFETAERLVEAGQVLANVLTENDRIDQDVAEEAFTSLAYGNRPDADLVRLRAERSVAWLERRTRSVRVQAPPGVTLSSATGGFAATLTNQLDHPVTISLKAITDAALAVETPPTIDLAARGSQTVVLQARASTPGVHYVRLVVTDDTGAPLGSSAMLPVRSSQVSEVIWLILGVGVGLLLLAIAVRLVRRLRSERG